MDTIEDGTYTAVVDRIEDDLAALVIEEEGTDIAELVVEVADLPAEARRVDAVVYVELVDEALVSVTVDEEEAVARKDDAQSRFVRLSKRPPDES